MPFIPSPSLSQDKDCRVERREGIRPEPSDHNPSDPAHVIRLLLSALILIFKVRFTSLNSKTTTTGTAELRSGSTTGTVLATGTITHTVCNRSHWVTIIFSDCADVVISDVVYIVGEHSIPSSLYLFPVCVRRSGGNYFLLSGQRSSAISILLRGGSIDSQGTPTFTFASSSVGIYISVAWVD